MRLDYVSPLPPVRSGIADYSLDLLPHLMELCEVRVIGLPDQPVAPEVVERYRPAAAADTGAGGRLPLYQMGNNRHHAGVERLAMARPGVVTLHDLVLHHLLLDQTLGRSDDLDPYLERLAADHGWMGEAVARAKSWTAFGEAPTFALPAHRTLLRRQRGVLVHSRWAAREVLRGDPEIRVEAVPMGVPLPPPADADAGRDLRRRLGLPETAPVIGCFGFQTPIKRTAAAVAALAAPGLEQAHLLIVGEVAPVLDLETEARRAGVAERVRVTGYLDFADFTAALGAVDLCLNLRYPTAGETSASLLRILAAGCPAVVSDYAQFAELPDEVVAKVPLGEGEGEALAAALRLLLAQPERRAAMAAAGRELVRREHDPARAAAAVFEACRRWRAEAPPGDAPAEVPPPTSRAWSELAGALEVAGAGSTWVAGERRRLAVRLVNHGPATWLAGDAGAGGVALEVRLVTSGRDLFAGRPWRPLPRDLPAGEELTVELDVRRPPGETTLTIEPHVLGGFGFSALGGPVWRREL